MDICIILADPNNGYHGSDEHLQDIVYAFIGHGWQVTMCDGMKDEVVYGAASNIPRAMIFNHLDNSAMYNAVRSAITEKSKFCVIVTDFIPAIYLGQENMFLMVEHYGLFQYTQDAISQSCPRWDYVSPDSDTASPGMDIVRNTSPKAVCAMRNMIVGDIKANPRYFDTKENSDDTTPPAYYMKPFGNLENSVNHDRDLPEHCIVHCSSDEWRESARSIATILHICIYKYDKIGLIVDDTISQYVANELSFVQQMFCTSDNLWKRLTKMIVVQADNKKSDLMRDVDAMLCCSNCQLVINVSRRIGSDIICESFSPNLAITCDTISILPPGKIGYNALKGMISHSLKINGGKVSAYMLNRDNLWTDLCTRAIVAPVMITGMCACCESGDIKKYTNRDIIASLPNLIKELMLERMVRYHGDGDET